MDLPVFGVVFGVLTGAFVSALNYLVSRTVLRKKPKLYTLTPVARQVINVGYLIALYFLSPSLPWGRTLLLFSGVTGITVSMIFFTFRLVKEAKSAPPGRRTKGEK